MWQVADSDQTIDEGTTDEHKGRFDTPEDNTKCFGNMGMRFCPVLDMLIWRGTRLSDTHMQPKRRLFQGVRLKDYKEQWPTAPYGQGKE